MFSATYPRWFEKTSKALIVALVAPLISLIPVLNFDAPANAATVGSGACTQTVGSNSGVSVATVGNDCLVTFTSTTPTTWTVPAGVTSVTSLVVGGGGGAGYNTGGGGSGGQVNYTTNQPVTPFGSLNISVGLGGAGAIYSSTSASAGSSSSFGSTTSSGGLAGTNFIPSPSNAPAPAGASVNGGPGAGGRGAAASGSTGSAGTAGVSNSITGTAIYYAGGGGGGGWGNTGGTGGSGGGGAGTNTGTGNSGTANTGSGGGASGDHSNGGAGGTGVVILRFSGLVTITFDGNNATSGAPSIASVTQSSYGASVTLATAGTLLRTGYTFSGWNTAADASGTTYAVGSSVTPNASITLYAIWKSTISYDTNTATSSRAIESTTANTSSPVNTLSNGKLIPGKPISSGLVFNMNAADSSSVVGSTWYDASRNGVTGTMTGTPTYNSKEGYIQLDGSSQYISLGSSILPSSGSSPYTVSVMFKSDKPNVNDQAIISKYYSNGQWILRTYTNAKFSFWKSGNGAGDLEIYTPTSYNEGDINYGTISFDGNTMKLYQNGVLANSYATTRGGGSSTNELLIGARGITGSVVTMWAGRIYSAQAYSRALSDTEVAQNYQTMIPGQIATKANFTLAGWNSAADGSGTSYTTKAVDISALPTPYTRLLPSNFTSPGTSGTWSTPLSTTWTSPVGTSLGVSVRGTVGYNSSAGGAWGATAQFPTLSGSTTDGILLNNSTLTTFTMCVVARYKDINGSGGVQKRIIAGKTQNWLSGFYYSLRKFHHEAWNYDAPVYIDYNWHYYCDSGNRAFWDGSAVPWTYQTNTTLPPIGINFEYYGSENSDWELADLIIYDQYLSDSQIQQVNRYFKNTYGIIGGQAATTAAVTSANSTYPSPGNTTLYAMWGSHITYDGNLQSTGSVPAPSLITGTSGALASNSGSLTRAGFRFDGWNTAADGSGTNYAAGGTYQNIGNAILYAKWTLLTVFPTSTSLQDPVNLGPYMRFKAPDFDPSTRTWKDSSGNGRNIASSGITGFPKLVTAPNNGASKSFQAVQGSAAYEAINFGNPTLTNYTLFTVARYPGSTRGRIFSATDGTQLFGFWSGLSGVSWHYGWITQYATTVHGDNWVQSTDLSKLYRSNGVSRTTAPNTEGYSTLRELGINTYSAEHSDFQVAEVIIFDRTLSSDEYLKVEDYLNSTYGISGYSLANTYPTSKTYYFGTTAGGRTDTLTATNGLGTKSFSISPQVSGITLDTSTTNGVAVVVSALVPTGIYTETLTATDKAGATATFQVVLNVAPAVKFDTSTPTTLTTTYGKSASLQLNTVNGLGTKVFSILTNPLSHFSLDTSTAGSGYATLSTTGFVKPGTYSVVVAVTDATGLVSKYTVSVTVNSTPLITYPSGTVPSFKTSNLVLHYDITNPLSYSGTETRVADLVGSNYASIVSSTPYSSSYGGNLNIAGNNFINGSTCISSIAGSSMSIFMWINPRGDGVVLNEKASGWFTSTIDISSGAVRFRIYNGAILSYTLPSLNKWYYVGMTYNGTTEKAYVNGVLVGSAAVNRTVATGSVNCLSIGEPTGGSANLGVTTGGQFQFGALQAYSVPLLDTEVAGNYEVTQKNYLTSMNKSGSYTINTTAGFAADYSLFTASQGTGNKTFALSPPVTGLSLDTTTVNTAILKIGTGIAATNSTTAATYTETLTATDSVTGVTKYDLSITVNPIITITPTTAVTLSTTVGYAAYDTFTANYGTGTKTFSEVASGYDSAFSISSPSTNVGLLTVASNLPVGTYTDTITALDAVGATTTYVLTVVVNPVLAIAGATSNSVATTFGKATSLRINLTGGTGTKRMTISSPAAGITLDTSTLAGSSYSTLNVSTSVPVGVYSFNVTAVDTISATDIESFTVTVNRTPTIGTQGIVSSNLKVNFDGTSYSGSGSWLDQSGNGVSTSTGTGGTAPSYQQLSSSGAFSFNETTSATNNYMEFPNQGSMETFTISTWVKFSSVPAANATAYPCIICEKFPAANNKINFGIFFAGNQIMADYFDGTRWVATAADGGSLSTMRTRFTPSSNTWYNIVYSVYKVGSTYYNDMIVNNSRVALPIATTTAPATQGSAINLMKRWDNAEFTNGQLGSVMLYNRALSDTEVAQNYVAQSPRYNAAFSTTQGINSSITQNVASGGTGDKSFALTPTVSGVTLDTSVANAYTLNVASTVAATDSVTSRLIYETVTATDSVSAKTSIIYALTINPPVQETYTAASITTTSSIAAYDTFTASYGTGAKTFTLTGSPTTAGFTLTQSNNQAVLKVEPTANPGTYYETITARDTVGATKSLMVTIVVTPPPTLLGPNTLVASKSVLFRSPAYTLVNGNGPFTYSLSSKAISPDTNTTSSITFDSATMTLKVDTTTGAGTYVETITVTDAKGATSKLIISLTVKEPISITGGSLTINKSYGDLYQQTYFVNNLTPLNGSYGAGFKTTVGSVTDICVPIVGTNGSNTYEMMTATGSCSWTAPTGVSTVDYLVAAGGGAGAGSRGGGGGGGGVAAGASLPVTAGTTYGLNIGAGGAAVSSPVRGNNGGNSWIGTSDGATKYVTAGGGGGGGALASSSANNGNPGSDAPTATIKSAGGAGGGGGPNFWWNAATLYYSYGGASGSGTVTAYSGGNSYRCDNGGSQTLANNNANDGQKASGTGRTTGGGGGAGSVGIGFAAGTACPAFTVTPPNGGSAVSSTLTGSTLYFGAGGGGADGRGAGGAEYSYGSSGPGVGTNGGGNGEAVDVPTSGSNATLVQSAVSSTSGADNTGGGGGGGVNTAGSGGSGAIILRYPTQARVTNAISLTTISNGSSTTSASVLLTVPENVTAGATSKVISVTNAGTTTNYTVNINIAKAIPTVSIALPGNVSTGKYGNAVTLYASVSTDGTVEFKDSGTAITGCSAVSSSSGIATCTWTPSVVGTRNVTAKISPSDSTNYDSSTTTSAVVIGKADTLTVDAGDETFTYTGTAPSLVKPFTYDGLVSIDTLTVVGMVYTGTANDGTTINQKTAPILAGTFIVTPDTTVAGISSISANYVSVALVTGTLTINRALPTLALVYATTDTVTYSVAGTIDTTTASRSGNGAKSFTTTSTSNCSVNSTTARISILKAGTCLVTMSVAQGDNYLASSIIDTVTILKASRTISLTASVSTLKYYDTTTVTATLSGGANDGAITFALNATPGCSIDVLSYVLTATSGTLACTLNATVAAGDNYLAATTASPLALTIAKATAPVITLAAISAVDYNPGYQAAIVPTYTFSGFKGSDQGDTVTLTYGFVSNPYETFSYSSTTKPTDAGTYSITPSALVMKSGLLTNYETPNYAGSAINFTINRIAQAAITITNVNGEITVPYTLNIVGGNNPTGSTTYSKVGGTCTVSGNQVTASSAGQCLIRVTLSANRNYLAVTSDTITISIRKFDLIPVFVFSNPNTGITLSGSTPLTIGQISCTTGCAPTITLATPNSGQIGDIIVLTGTQFTGVTRVIFNVFTDAISFNADSDTQIIVQIPAGVVPTAFDAIDVVTPGGTSARFYDFTILP